MSVQVRPRVIVWNEHRVERDVAAAARHYPSGMHTALVDGLVAHGLSAETALLDRDQLLRRGGGVPVGVHLAARPGLPIGTPRAFGPTRVGLVAHPAVPVRFGGRVPAGSQS